MVMLAIAAFVLGCVGFLGMTWLFPMFAWALHSLLKRRQSAIVSDDPLIVKSIAILIPAHNEEHSLSHTLASVLSAIAKAKETWAGNFKIYVGADGCTDNTAALARWYGAEVIETTHCQGKWRTLHALIHHSGESDWCILADCGIHWPREFLIDLLPYFVKEKVMAVAPTYRNSNGGIVERCIWKFERHMKLLEVLSGGPISVHGATVCYRRKELLPALQVLGEQQWLNDDVVVPLCMRGLYPHREVQYLSNVTAFESRRKEPHSREFHRRRRMVVGNIEWISSLLIPLYNRNFIAACLALRRVFRLMWAYWFVLIAVGAMLAVRTVDATGEYAWYILLTATLSVYLLQRFICTKSARSLFDSACASILAPYYFVLSNLTATRLIEIQQWK